MSPYMAIYLGILEKSPRLLRNVLFGVDISGGIASFTSCSATTSGGAIHLQGDLQQAGGRGNLLRNDRRFPYKVGPPTSYK